MKLREVVHPLPGSVVRENRRPVPIRPELDGLCLLDGLCRLFPHVEMEEWLGRIGAGRFLDGKGGVLDVGHVLRAGERVWQVFPPAVEPEVAADVRVVHADEEMLVVCKPAPLPMHPSGRYCRNTLKYFMDAACAPQVVRAVHRLDANTSGLVVFGMTREACRALQCEFVEGRVEKRYLVRVMGHPVEDGFTCSARISREAGRVGVRVVDEVGGLDARTDFKVLHRDSDGTALLEAMLHTGRTNQVRVHLWHLGHPVVGDPSYLPGGGLGGRQALSPQDLPMMLQAAYLRIRHPKRGEWMEFRAPLPSWAEIREDKGKKRHEFPS